VVLRCLLQIGIIILKTRLVTRLPLNVHKMSLLKCFTVSDFVSSVYTAQPPIELFTIIYRTCMKLLASSYVYAGFPDNNNNYDTTKSPVSV